MGAEFYLDLKVAYLKSRRFGTAPRERTTREEEITGTIQAKKAWFVNDGTSAQKRNKNDYRREPDVLIPVTTPAQVLSEPHQ
jgi:hypothetical protein